MIVGDARFESRLFSNQWLLLQGDDVVARLFRIPSRHTSELETVDGPAQILEPEAWGTVIARTEDGTEFGRIVRRSWWGRAWEIQSPGFGCTLTSDPLPRRWSLRFGSEPVGRLAGGLITYNSVDLHTDVAVPVTGLALAWHVIARPWEQAAAPGALVARPAPGLRGALDA
jgi:hypothetical protein